MADKDDTTSTRSGRNQADEHVSAEMPPLLNGKRPRSLQQAIEAERAQLLQAHAVIHCLYEVLLHADGDDSICYAEAAYVAANLIDESVERLDSVKLRPLMDDLIASHTRKNEVKEARGIYLVNTSG